MKKRGRFDIRNSLLNKLQPCDRICCICGSTENMTAHHINRRSNGGKDIPQNLIGLCRKHHDMIDGFKECLPLVSLIYEEQIALIKIEKTKHDIISKLLKKKQTIRKLQKELKNE